MNGETIEERVAELERVTRKLASSTETLKRGQRETKVQVRRLERLVEGIPAQTQAQIDAQTQELKTEIAQGETRNADRVTDSYADLAREWPAASIVVATVAMSALVGVIVKVILAYYHVG